MKKHRSPGPAAYTLPDFTGSGPAATFGTQMRGANPVYPGNASPGPTIALKSSLGRNKDCTFVDTPAPGFGVSKRLQESAAVKMPGPGEYKLPSSVGVHDQTKKRLPSFEFGTAGRLEGAPAVPRRLNPELQQRMARSSVGARFGDNTKNNVTHALAQLKELGQAPGPGAYDTTSYRKRNVTGVTIPKGPQRPVPSSRSVKAPGPGHYGMATTVGENCMATIRKGCSVTFGVSRSNKRPNDPGPGPGTYPCKSAFGTQTSSRSMPSYRFGQTPRETGVYD